MSDSLRSSIYESLASIRLIDPHTHINPHNAGSNTLADILGYHYYTELVHSAGMPKAEIEHPGLSPKELVGQLVTGLGAIENTANYKWLIELCRMFFGFDGDRIDASNWEDLYDSAESRMQSAEWPQMVLDQSNVESVFLTNDFDDALEGFDTNTYIPCLRTDDLVFHLAKPEVRERLEACTGIALTDLASLRDSLRQRFEHFVAAGARACAISIPPSFTPTPVKDGRAATALDNVLRSGLSADASHHAALSRRVFWTLAELCDEFGLPFDLMIGVNRGVYPGGVYQGQDLYDSRVSLIQYKDLFNSFPSVKFPISVLASVTNQELVDYSWIFPNVLTNGHWWYSNTPSIIARDAAARLEAVPQTKQIAYYSDAYKLEFVWPKFDMYRQILAGVLADHFVGFNGWSEEQAVQLGRRVLRTNVDEVFPRPTAPRSGSPTPLILDAADEFPEVMGEVADTAAAQATESTAAGDDLNDFLESVDQQGSQRPEINPETPPSSADTVVDDENEGFVTVIDETAETVTSDQLADAGTIFEEPTAGMDTQVDDGISAEEINELESADASMETIEITEDMSDGPEFDPLPSHDELQTAGVDDVEISDRSDDVQFHSAESIAEHLDDEPLDVGDLMSSGDDTPKIKSLTGEQSFAPDDDDLKLTSDPETGEFLFPIDDEDDSDDASDEKK